MSYLFCVLKNYVVFHENKNPNAHNQNIRILFMPGAGLKPKHTIHE